MSEQGSPDAELAAARDALRRANARMHCMLESLTDGFCAVDRDWRITYINGRALHLLAPLGKTREGLLGRSVWDEFEELGRSSLGAVCRAAMETQQAISREFFHAPLDIWLDLRAHPSPDGLTIFFQDITRRIANEQALVEGGKRLQLALAAGQLGDWHWDAETDCITFGQHGGAVVGLAPATAHPWQRLADQLDPDDRARVRNEWLRAHQQGSDLNLECRLPMEGDGARWIALAGRASSTAAASMSGVVQDISIRKGAEDKLRQSEEVLRALAGIAAQVAVAIDNTRLYEAAQQAAEERKVLLESERLARAEAERTSQMKDEFLATLSHELRTPLSAILGWTQVLRGGSRDGADLQRGLQTIERNARAQAQLIEDLLDMSRISSGKVLLDMQTVAPRAFLDAAIETVRPAADAKNIRIDKHYERAAGVIAGDPARLQQVIWNLLSNAIKFTPRDGVVTIELARRAGHVAIIVRDTGAGIKPEFIPHVFERFRQADASTTRRHGGLGLGLSIVKHLIEQHGGTVRAESAGAGRGASFTIELPLANQHAAPARAERAPYTLPTPATPELTLRDLSGVAVLVVDDDRDARELIARILTDCHATVRIAASAREAFAALRAAPPDLLISDLGMPEVDGFGLLGWVRALARDAGGQVPAVALTAFARSEDRLRALEAGFSAHIPKPVEPRELIATVATILGPATPLVSSAGPR